MWRDMGRWRTWTDIIEKPMSRMKSMRVKYMMSLDERSSTDQSILVCTLSWKNLSILKKSMMTCGGMGGSKCE